MESKTKATMWKRIKNCFRYWCPKWLYILFGATYRQNKEWLYHCICNFNVDCNWDNSVSIWHEFGRVSPKSHRICLKEFLLTCCTSASVYFAPSFFSLSLPFPDSSGCCQLELGSLPGVGVPTLSRGSARLHLMGRRTIRIIVLFLADWVQSSQPQFSCFGYTSSTKDNVFNETKCGQLRRLGFKWLCLFELYQKKCDRAIFQNLTSYYRQ